MHWKFTKEVGDPHSRYAPDAFANVVGTEIPFTADGFVEEVTQGKVLDVVVHEQGCCAEFLIEIPDDCALAEFLKRNNLTEHISYAADPTHNMEEPDAPGS